jgi:hypothetical protein
MRAFHVPEAKNVWKSLDNLLLDHLVPPSEDGQKQNQIYGGLSLANDKAVDGLDVFLRLSCKLVRRIWQKGIEITPLPGPFLCSIMGSSLPNPSSNELVKWLTDDCPTQLLYILDHQYTSAELSFTRIKGVAQEASSFEGDPQP